MRALRARDPASPALGQYREAAALLTGQPDATIEDGIDWLRRTVALLGIPGLGTLGVRPGMAVEIVAKVGTASSTKGNPAVLTDGELRAAFDTAFG